MPKSNQTGKLRTAIICAVIALVGIIFLVRLFPGTSPTETGIQKLYTQVAYNAALIQEAVGAHHTAQTLHDAVAGNQYEEGFMSEGKPSSDEKSVSWFSEVRAVENKKEFMSSAEQINLKACVQITAYVESQTVSVTSIDCMHLEENSDFLSVGGQEVKLDAAKILETRNDRSQHLECQAIGEGRSKCE